MFLETDGIVLRTSKSTNNDIFLTILTRKAGKIEVVANGAKSSRSPLSACSKPFVFGLFMINTSGKMMKLVSCTIHESNFRITESLEAFAYGSYIFEVCHHTTHKNVIEPEHYTLIVEIADILSKQTRDYKLLQLAYLVKLSKFTGHMPNLTDKCMKCGETLDDYVFAVEEGGLIHRHCAGDQNTSYKLNLTFIQILRYLLVKDIRVVLKTKFHDKYINKLLPMMETYLMYHTEMSAINSKAFIEML